MHIHAYSNARIPRYTDCESGTKCRYTLTGLEANTPYGVLIVAANSATDDPECIEDVTVLGSRYLVLVVGTKDAKPCEFFSLQVCMQYIHVHVPRPEL